MTLAAAKGTIFAAGAVCWTMRGDKLRVLLIERDRRADVSLPKGKVDAGETLPETAVREILEETGYAVHLGAPLGTSEYSLPGGRPKIVHYWAAEVSRKVIDSAAFESNDEVTALRWVSVKKARAQLTYERDRDVLDRFAARVAAKQLHTFAIIALRHGKAVPPSSWSGPDFTRPLMSIGIAQSESAARGVAAFRPAKLISSTATRCVTTIGPLAKLLGLDVKATAAISQDSFDDGSDDVGGVVAKRIARAETTVLCSHGPVLPEILRAVALQTRTPDPGGLRRAGVLELAAYTIAHLTRGESGLDAARLVAVETHYPVLAG